MFFSHSSPLPVPIPTFLIESSPVRQADTLMMFNEVRLYRLRKNLFLKGTG
jgi:hypothetical protein